MDAAVVELTFWGYTLKITGSR